MKINKLTSALVAMGCLSLAGVAQAQTTIYLTGSTAARQFVFDCLTNQGSVFTNAGTILSTVNNAGSFNLFTIEGKCTNGGIGDVIVNCNFTGSEAGIATVTQYPLTQSLPGNPHGSGPYALPGTGASCLYLDAPNYITTNTTYAAGADITMADTSQAVSYTPYATYPAQDYGVVGVVPFTWMKCYDSAPSSTWSNLVNVTTATVNQNFTGGAGYKAYHYTGNLADNVGVAIIGRNLGSGTRANTLLNMQVGVTAQIIQYAWGTLAALYPAATPGVLTVGSSYAIGQGIVSVGNDGYDSGSGVQKSLNVDEHGAGGIVIGYAGVSDAKNALNPAKAGAGQTATALQFNGFFESDSNVINGSYTFWGQEHVLGKPSASAAVQAFTAALQHGIAQQLVNEGAGLVSGDIRTYNQSLLIPNVAMKVKRGVAPYGSDTGFPVQGTW